MIRILAAVVLLEICAAAQTCAPTGGIRITLERIGACCLNIGNPVYTIAMTEDGTVVYEGKYSVHVAGTRKAKVNVSAIRQLAQEFVAKGYFNFPNSYGSCMDGGIVRTSLEMSGRVKKIEDGCGAGPATLRELEDEIDRVTNSKYWVRGRLRVWLHWPWHHS